MAFSSISFSQSIKRQKTGNLLDCAALVSNYKVLPGVKFPSANWFSIKAGVRLFFRRSHSRGHLQNKSFSFITNEVVNYALKLSTSSG